MTFDLVGRGGHMNLTMNTWTTLLDLAQQYGWEPMGTEVNLARARANAQAAGEEFDPDDLYWRGSYLCAFGDIVGDQDAKNLAAALERFLSEYPTDEALVGRVWTVYVPDYYARGLKEVERRVGGKPNVVPPALDVTTIRQLADFCKEGSFMIN